jgi:hypothetical protein
MWASQDNSPQAANARAAKAREQARLRYENALWQRHFRLLQQLEQKWLQIQHELQDEFLDPESFEGYRQSIRQVCRNNDLRLTNGKLL